MGNRVAVGTEICADLPALIDTSLDCSLCTIGFPQFGGRFGVSFHTSNFCVVGGVEPSPSVWINGMYTQFGQLKCKQPGDSEPDPGLFAGIGQFSGIGYTNPVTGRGSSHKFRYTVDVRPTSEYTLDVNWICQVIGPRSIWHPYSALRFEMVEVLGPNDDPSIPYRNRMYAPTSGTSYTRWKGETYSYPPPAGAKGDIYTTEWSKALQYLPAPFPPQTGGGMAFMWNGDKWAEYGFLTRWDIEKKRADNGQSINLRTHVPIAVDTSIAGAGDGITSAMFILGLESMREGCGGGGNSFPACGMWFPTLNDSYGSGWHTCFRVITQPDGGLPWFTTIGADTPDCGKVFRVDDGTIQYGPFCGCDKLEKTVHGKWRSLKNDDLPCYFPEVVTIGVPGEDTATVQEIQTNGTGSIVVKQLDGGKIWACHGIATGEDPASPNKCSLMDWEFVEVTSDKVVATGSPYVYKLRFESHKLTMWLHSLRFPSDPIMPDACAPQTPPAWKWKCVNGKCEPAADGQYKTLDECQKACETPPPKKWWCVGGTCVESVTPPVGNTGGPWDTADECSSSCKPDDGGGTSKWWCIYGTLLERETSPHPDALGPYTSSAAANCGPPEMVWHCAESGPARISRWEATERGFQYYGTEQEVIDSGCGVPPEDRNYWCITGNCHYHETPPPYGEGPFTEFECLERCGGEPPPVFEPAIYCVEVGGVNSGLTACTNLGEPASGIVSGPYQKMEDCWFYCGNSGGGPGDGSSPYSGYYCVPETNPTRAGGTPYTCISWGGTSGPPAGATGGKYATLEACVAGCAGTPDPDEPSIPYWCVQTGQIGVKQCARAVTAPPGTVSGPYLTQTECASACQSTAPPDSPVMPTSRSIHPIERLKLPCVNMGESLGMRKMDCRCGSVEVFKCGLHGECTRYVEGFKGVPFCLACPDYLV